MIRPHTYPLAVCLLALVGAAHAAPQVHFDQSSYVVPIGQTFDVQVILDGNDGVPLDQPLANGLLSLGVRVGFDPAKVGVAGASSVALVTELDSDGLDGPPIKVIGANYVGVKAAVPLGAGPYVGNRLCTVRLNATTAGSCTLTLGLFRQFPSDQVFFDGSYVNLDSVMRFVSASVTVQPPAVRGDFDGNGKITTADVDLLYSKLNTTVPPTDAKFDLTGDGKVNSADVRELFANILHTSPADTNLDHVVDILDLGNMANSFGGPGRFADGDTDGDGMVDILDLGNLADDYGKSFPPG